MSIADLNYDPYDREIDLDPYPVYKRLRDEAPLYRNDVHDFWALSRFDDVTQALSNARTYSSGHGNLLELIKAGFTLPGSILCEDPPEHGLHRRLTDRMFAPRRIAALEAEIRDHCVAALDPHVGSGGFDFVTDFGARIPMQVIGMLLGIPDEFHAELQRRVRARLDPRSDDETNDAPDEPAGVDLLNRDEFLAAFYECVRWRLAHPGEDVITGLSRATFRDCDGTTRTLTEAELINCITVIVAAGTETTTMLIGWLAYLLGRYPQQRELLIDDPGRIAGAIEEALRIEAPVPVSARLLVNDVEHYGQTVPAGSAMLLVAGAANHDERVFDAPERFDVMRTRQRHITFGHGLHFCLGSALARLEARVVFEEALKRFPAWTLDESKLQRFQSSALRGWSSLPVLI